MKSLKFISLLLILWAGYAAVCSGANKAEKEKTPAVSPKILRAVTVYVDCSACPRALGKARTAGEESLRDWRRFRLTEDKAQANLIIMFSANPYLGDYATRDGPDTRPVNIKETFMTVIDPRIRGRIVERLARMGKLEGGRRDEGSDSGIAEPDGHPGEGLDR